MIDADGDGKITEEDLRVTMGNLGERYHNLSGGFGHWADIVTAIRTNPFDLSLADTLDPSFRLGTFRLSTAIHQLCPIPHSVRSKAIGAGHGARDLGRFCLF